MVSLWPVSTALKFESFLNSPYVKNIHNKKLTHLMWLRVHSFLYESKKVSTFLIRQFEGKKTIQLSVLIHRLLLPLAPLAPVLRREVKAFRIYAQVSLLHRSFMSIHDILWKSQDVLTLDSNNTNKVISHSLQHTAYIFNQWNISTPINQNLKNCPHWIL